MWKSGWGGSLHAALRAVQRRHGREPENMGMRRVAFGCGFKITPTGEGDVIRGQAESRLIK